MSKKKSSSKKNSSNQNAKAAQPVNKLPKWGLLVAALFAFLLVNVALIIMTKLDINNPVIRTGVVLVLATFAGIAARPLTMALQKRFNND